jgi:hypothetical protein
VLKRIAVLGFCLLLIAGGVLAACGTAEEATTTTSPAAAVTTMVDEATTTSVATDTTVPGDAPTGGAPPAGGTGPGGPPPGGGSGAEVYPTAAAYILSSGTETQDGQTYTATEQDESGILVTDGASLTLTNATVNTSGDSSDTGSSSFYGLNAAVVALTQGTITMSGGSITTSGSGANGAFAVGEGSVINLSDLTITATGGGGHGVMTTQGGTVNLTNVTMNTAGGSSAPLATDRGGGTVTATDCAATCSGQNSPCIYSTGVITVNGGTYTTTGSEMAVIEGANSIILNDVDLSSSFADKWGVMIYQSMSGDAEGTQGTFTMTGGRLALTAATGALFYCNNSTAIITLTGVDVSAGSGILINAAAGNWGTTGSNGGSVVMTTDSQTLTGDVTADNISTVNLTLQNSSSLSAAINADNTALEARLTLDATSAWDVTADSYLTSLTLSAGVSGTTITNVTGNGHTVYYDAGDSANSALGGKTYTLSGGGTLKPAG